LAIGVPGLGPKDRPVAGTVYVIRGDPSITRGIPVTFTLPEQADATIEGADGEAGTIGDKFGTRLALADVNQDGREDLIVGAPNASGPENRLAQAGEVYLWLGQSLRGQRFSIASQASWTVYGAEAGAVLGSAIATGDFDHDTYPEILLGCYDCASEATPPLWLSGRGYVLEPLEITGQVTVTSVSKLDLLPYKDARGLGKAVEAIDLDADGTSELVISAPWSDYAGSSLPGTLYVVSYPIHNRVYLPLLYK
jgi:hypothetical protein